MTNQDQEDLEHARWLVDHGYIDQVDVFRVLAALKNRRIPKKDSDDEPTNSGSLGSDGDGTEAS